MLNFLSAQGQSFWDILVNLWNSTGFNQATQVTISGVPYDVYLWQNFLMMAIACVLLYLAVAKQYEPLLLLPIAFGMFLINIPGAYDILYAEPAGSEAGGLFYYLAQGVQNVIFPPLIFLGIGAMTDFGPMIANPKTMLLGAAAQLGIFLTFLIALIIPSFSGQQAAAIAIIGGADGPTAIYVTSKLAPNMLGIIAIAAYSYMALVPIIQPITIKLCTTKKERAIKMTYKPGSVTKLTKILFPILVTVIAGLIAPASLALVGFLMFGNLLRECGVLNSLSETAGKVLSNLITLLLGITIAFQMQGEQFLQWQTLLIMALGLFAFVFDTMGGVFFAKLINLFSKEKINPMVGAAGISAFPMSARVVQKLGLEADPSNHLLMHAVGANVSGQIASVIAGGLLLQFVGATLGI